MQHRLDRGHVEYGDDSFELSSYRLADEIEEELLDIIGWAFIFWTKLQELKEKALKLDEKIGQMSG